MNLKLLGAVACAFVLVHLPVSNFHCVQPVFTASLLGEDSPKTAEPSPKVLKQLNETVVPAYRDGNTVAIAESISDLLNRVNAEKFAEIDAWFVEQGNPSLTSLLTNARIEMIESGSTAKQLRINYAEAAIVLPEMKSRIETINSQYSRHGVIRDVFPSASDWDGYEAMIWDVHVLANKLQSALRLAEFAGDTSKPYSRRFKTNATNKDKSPDFKSSDETNINSRPDWLVDYDQIAERIESRFENLYQQEIRLRIFRIEDAESTLADRSATKASRLKAAFALAYDANELEKFFAIRSKFKSLRPSLKMPGLKKEVSDLVKSGRENAGDTYVKATLLYVGTHYWIRGRYGAGPEAWGLLKNNAALQNEAAMFSLYMPEKIPAATDPLRAPEQLNSPQLDRRHHLVWKAEYRPFFNSQGQSEEQFTTTRTKKEKVNEKITRTYKTTEMSRFY